jgi:double-strand break repair protein MRE11
MALDNECLKIMVHTDTHLGYMERDAYRGHDSFASFEEALYNAKEKNCDLVIHAGDMFHENKPSRQTMHSAMTLFRKYCLGDDPVYFTVPSDKDKDEERGGGGAEKNNDEIDKNPFKANGGKPNFLSPHQAVSLPYFAIHGNHDDPSREGTTGEALSALDMLGVANLINYFGKSERVDHIVIRPIIIKKKSVTVALYGLGAIRDERLNRMVKDQKVEFQQPNTDDVSTYLNILVVHQNRYKGHGKNCLQESMIPKWMTLVIWGNEHQCEGETQQSAVGGFHIYQPGSSVATSLGYTESNAFPKKYGILEIIKGQKFRVTQHKYKQMRPFVFSNVALKDYLDPHDPKISDKLAEFLRGRVIELITEAREQSSIAEESYPGVDLTHRITNPTYVLVRLRVESDGFPSLHVQRFGQRFVGNVANPGDILLFAKQKKEKSALGSVKPAAKQKGDANADDGDDGSDDESEAVRKIKIEEFVAEQMDANKGLHLLPSVHMQTAIDNYVYKKSANAIADSVSTVLKKFQSALLKDQDSDANVGSLKEAASKLRVAEDAAANAAKGKEKVARAVFVNSDDEDMSPAPKAKAAPKARANKAPAAKPAPKKAAAVTKARATRGKRKSYEEDEDEEDDEGGEDSFRSEIGSDFDGGDSVVNSDSEDDGRKKKKKAATRKVAAPKKAPAKRAAARKPAAAVEEPPSQLDLVPGTSQAAAGGSRKRAKPSSLL